MLEKLTCYRIATSSDGNVFICAGSFSEAISSYLKSVDSVDDSSISSISRTINEVLV